MASWKQMAQFKAMVQEVLDSMGISTATGGVFIGVNPPAHPFAGQAWWNGSHLQVFDGMVWQAIGPAGGSTGGSTGGGSTGVGSVVISTTTPASPVAGMQWWNGSILQMFDGTTWKTIGPSATTGPVPTTTLTFRIMMPANLALGSTTLWEITPFATTPSVDTQNAFDPVTRRYTPTKAGTYLYIIRGYTAANGGIALLRNDSGSFASTGTEYVLAINRITASSLYLQAVGISVMNGSTDFVRMFSFDSSGNAQALASISAFEAYILP